LAGHPRDGIPLLRRAVALAVTPEQQAAAEFRLGMALLEEGQLGDAGRHFDALGRLERDGPRGHFGLGLVAAARDDRTAARAHLTPLLGSPFAGKRAAARLASLALADGDAAAARAHQERAARLPADVPWPDPFLAEQARYAVGRQSRLLEAERLEAQGRLGEAAAVQREVLAATPDAHAYVTYGITLAKLQQFADAEPVLRTALKLDPDKVQAHYFLGTVLFFEGEKQAGAGNRDRASELFRESVAEQERALALKPGDAMAEMMRGRALRALGRKDEGTAGLRRAVVGRPEFCDTHLALGEALAEDGHVGEAMAHFENAARFAPPGDDRPRRALEKWRPRPKDRPAGP
jgi:tetratricopeptide (TPR) repeat protein